MGPIRASTPFSRQALQALFPKAQVDLVEMQTGDVAGQTEQFIRIRDGQDLIMMVEGRAGRVVEVDVLDPKFSGPGGGRVDSPSDERQFRNSDCRGYGIVPASEGFSQMLCPSRAATNVLYGFRVERPIAGKPQLTGAMPKVIIWNPPTATTR